MPFKVSEYDPLVLPIGGNSLFDVSQYVSPGVYESVKLTYDQLKADLGAFVHGGNAFGETAEFGTTDNEEISWIVNNTEFMKVTVNGTVVINNILDAIALIVSADGFQPIAVSQNDTIANVTAIGAENFSEGSGASAASLVMRNTLTNSVSAGLHLIHLLTAVDSGEPGIGIGVKYFADDDDEQTQLMGQHYFKWMDVTHATRSAAYIISSVFEGIEEEMLAIAGRNLIFNDINTYLGIVDGEGMIVVVESQDPPSGTTGGYFQFWSQDIGGIDNVPHFMNGEGQIIKLYTPNSVSPYAITGGSIDRAMNAGTALPAEIANVVYTLIEDLKAAGHLA